MGGAAVYFWLAAAVGVLGEAGQPALTADLVGLGLQRRRWSPSLRPPSWSCCRPWTSRPRRCCCCRRPGRRSRRSRRRCTTMIAVADLLAALLLLGLGGQPGFPGRALTGSLVAGHGPRPYPIPEGASDRPAAARRPAGLPQDRPATDWRAGGSAVCSLVRMPLVVQKFGGTSVGDADRIRAVADHIARTRRAGHRGGGRGQRHGQDHRRPDPPGQLGQRHPAAPRVRHAREHRRAHLHVAACAWPWPTWASTPSSFTGSQVGIITDDDHTRAKILEVKGDRLREALAAGKVPVVAGFQGVSADSRDHHAGTRRLRRHGGGARRRTRRRRLRDLHRRHRGVHGGPPDRARGPPDQPDLLRRDARDGGHRRTGPDAARRRVRPEPQRPAARPEQFHLGARHVGRRGGCRHGRSRRHRRDPRHVGGQGHGQRRPRPPRRGGAALPRLWPTSRSTST